MSARIVRCAAVVLALVATACSGDDDGTALGRADGVVTTTTTEPEPVETPSESSTATSAVPEVRWEPCGSAECATVAVPLDHDDPASGTIDLFVTRLPATGDRIGPLFVNFGGPGAGAASIVGSFPVPASVRARFDIVAMDPRGVGRSTPLECGLPPATLYSADPTIEDQADVDALVDVSQRYADDCAARAGDLLAHIGTRNVARDMDAVRAGMGDATLSYLGFSYGTAIGQAYAEQFPDRVRAMVLDGVVDPAAEGVDFAVEQAVGFESALASWADGCPTRSTCPFGTGALGAVDDVLARAEAGVASSGGARALGPGEAAIGLAYPLYQESLWSALDRAVAAALAGDGAPMVALADDYLTIVEFDAYFGVSCIDSAWPDSTRAHLDAGKAAAGPAPRFGEAIVNDYLRCAVWPAPRHPLGPVSAPGSPPILVVSTTGDPATPYENGVAVAERLEQGVLLTNDGEGHTIVFQGSACVDAATVAYLVEGTVPAAGARC